eukprot:jgi/Psemu1/5690/gm1.5690_g
MLASFIEGYDEAHAIDKTLEAEFSSILKQCNIVEGPVEALLGSQTKSSDPEDESCHSSIIDSTHQRSSCVDLDDLQTTETGVANPFPTLRSIANGTYYSSSIFPRWIGRRRNKSLFFSRIIEDIKNPLLNPNAIHDREAIDMLDIECRDDVLDNTRQTSGRDQSRLDTIGDYESTSICLLFAMYPLPRPVLRVIGPSFARDRRKGRFQKSDTAIGSKKEFSPTSGRPPRSPVSPRNPRP